VRYALICHHDPDVPAVPRVEFTYWGTRAQAQQALDELTPCGRRCVGVHTIVAVDAAPSSRHPVNRRRGTIPMTQ
jgi:hypothetical protein